MRTEMISGVRLALAWLAASSLLANPVLEWNEQMVDAIRADSSPPTLASRNLAILHTAVYDTVNSIRRTHQPYQFQLDALPTASVEAAVAGAAHDILVALYPGWKARADALFSEQTQPLTGSPGFNEGLALGKRVAQLSLENRSADGASTQVPYVPKDSPGEWRRTPPYFRPPTSVNWPGVRFFALPELEPFAPGPPPPLGSAAYADAFNQVIRLGALASTERTAEQSEIARFWSDFSYTSTPPGHWLLIAAEIARARNETLADSARLLALLSIALADAAVVSWAAKYRYNLWRPVTAIREADRDGNDLTSADPTWQSFLATPSFPSYVSGHSTFSHASAQVLTRFFGTDAIAFTATSDTVLGVTRSYQSLEQCADEIGLSRIYGGIHYSFDDLGGKQSGKKVGAYVGTNWLLPHSRLPLVLVEDCSKEAVKLRLHGIPGQDLALQASPDLINWTEVFVTRAVPGGVAYMEPALGTGHPRFFRLR